MPTLKQELFSTQHHLLLKEKSTPVIPTGLFIEYGTRLGHGREKRETHNLSFFEIQEYLFSWSEKFFILCLQHVSGATQV